MDKQQTMGNIQWFPGHMTKTRRKMQASLPLVDMVVEILDARIPVSSRNPDFDTLIAGKPRVVVLNKADIADEGDGLQKRKGREGVSRPSAPGIG